MSETCPLRDAVGLPRSTASSDRRPGEPTPMERGDGRSSSASSAQDRREGEPFSMAGRERVGVGDAAGVADGASVGGVDVETTALAGWAAGPSGHRRVRRRPSGPWRPPTWGAGVDW